MRHPLSPNIPCAAAAALAAFLVLSCSARAQTGPQLLERLTTLISTADLPSGFQEQWREGNAELKLGAISWKGDRGETVKAQAVTMEPRRMQSWLHDSIQALSDPQYGLRTLELGDAAFANRGSTTSNAYVIVGNWLLSVHVQGPWSAAEANPLAEKLIRKMHARFTGGGTEERGGSEMRAANENPVIQSVSYSPPNPTYDDDLTLIVTFRDPEGDPVRVRWWYPSGSTTQQRDFELGAGSTTHSFTMPGKPVSENVEIQVYVYDSRGGKAGTSSRIPVEAPVAAVTGFSGTITITRRIGRLAALRTRNLYHGDKVNFSGMPDGVNYEVSTVDIHWPASDTSGHIERDARGSDSLDESITIGGTPGESGFPERAGDFLFNWATGKGKGKGMEMILSKPVNAAIGSFGSFEKITGRGGSSGFVCMELRSHVVIREQGDGSLAFYTLEGSPILTGASGRPVEIPAGMCTRIGDQATVATPIPFEPSSLGDVSLAGTSSGSTARSGHTDGGGGKTGGSAVIQRVSVQPGVVRAEGVGLLVKTDLQVRGRKGVPTQITTFFGDVRGTMLLTLNKRYANPQGYLCAWSNLRPAYDDASWTPFSQFIPYRELPLAAGSHQLQTWVRIHDAATGQELTASDTRPFSITIDGTLGGASLSNISVDHNQLKDGQRGLLIHYDLDTYGRMGKQTYVVAHFQFANGQQVLDADGLDRDSDGKVATFLTHVAEHESAHWAGAAMFLAYDQLHLAPGEHQLHFVLRVADPPTNAPLARSEAIHFSVNQR